MAGTSLFQPADKTQRYLKVLLHGAPGTGKTLAALSFPRPLAVIDLEGGTALYSGDFDVLRTKDIRRIEQAVDELAWGGYKTIVIDPLTVLWQLLQDAGQALVDGRQNKDSLETGKALTPREWGLIKRKNSSLLTRLINLPIHVVLIARDSDQYEGTGDNLRKVGIKADVEKGTPYLADFVFNMQAEPGQGKNGDRFYAIVEKSRSLLLPKGARLDNYTSDPASGLFVKHLESVATAQTTSGRPMELDDDSSIAANNATVLEAEPQAQQASTPAPTRVQPQAPKPVSARKLEVDRMMAHFANIGIEQGYAQQLYADNNPSGKQVKDTPVEDVKAIVDKVIAKYSTYDLAMAALEAQETAEPEGELFPDDVPVDDGAVAF